MSGLLSASRLGEANRARVLQVLGAHGPMSRADLAKVAGVTRATMGNIVRSLIAAGILEEGETQTGVGRVGKPGRPVWFGPKAGLCGAAALGVGTVDAALVNARGDVIDITTREFDPAATTPLAAVRATAAALRIVLPAHAGVLGIGIAIPGVCDTVGGTIIGSGQLPGLSGHGFVTGLRRYFDLPILIDNDSRAQALGEKWFGDGRNLSTFVSLQTGHGLGAGIVVDGAVVRGHRGLTGELGHTCVDPAGEWCRCGLRGCWETIATLRWLRGRARKARLPGASHLDGAGLVKLADTNPAAADLLDDYADNLAIGLANMVQLLHPQAFILHGDVATAGAELQRRVEERTRAHSLVYLRPSVKVVLSALDQRATLLGAAGVVLSERFGQLD